MATKSIAHHRCVANGIKFPYARGGEGPPVVLLHGFPETSYAWRYQIEALKTRYRLIVPDLRGYGATDKAWTDAQRPRLGRRYGAIAQTPAKEAVRVQEIIIATNIARRFFPTKATIPGYTTSI